MITNYKDYLLLEVSKQNKSILDKWMEKDGGEEYISYSDYHEMLDFINDIKDTNTYMLFAYYFIFDDIMYDDLSIIEDCVKAMKIDKLSYNDIIKKYDSIMDYYEESKKKIKKIDINEDYLKLIDSNKNFKIYEINDKYVNPNKIIEFFKYNNIDYYDSSDVVNDNIMELTNQDKDILVKKLEEIGYDVNYTEKLRKYLIDIIHTQRGDKAQPWCLLKIKTSFDEVSGMIYWYMIYCGTKKYVCFKNDNIVSFGACLTAEIESESKPETNWYDLQDNNNDVFVYDHVKFANEKIIEI